MTAKLLDISEEFHNITIPDILIKKRNENSYQILNFKISGFSSDYGRGEVVDKKTVEEIMQSYPDAFL